MIKGIARAVVFGNFLFALLLPVGLFAQSAGTISGTVSDESGAVIPNADVTIANLGTGQTRALKTNEAGRYYAPGLNPGNYQVTAVTSGFEQTVRTGITLTVGSDAVINITLKPGQVTETVNVTAEAPEVQTTTSSVAALVDSQKIRALPLNGRSFDQLIFLQPGVNVATGAGSSPNQGRGTKFSANGARLTSNLFMLDGTDINDSQNFTPGGAGGQLFGVESIQEFQVLTHNPSAQYGRSMGGIINSVTRSGSNTFHGSLYEFLRNSKLDARNFFDGDTVPPFKRNQFGATAGGPIRKDHLFVFGNYEGLRERFSVSKSPLVPDANARQGIITDVNGNVTQRVTVNPVVVPYLNLYPLPNAGIKGNGIGVYQFNPSQPDRTDYGTARIDWVASEKDGFFVRYTMDDSMKLRRDALDHDLGLFAESEPHRNQYVTLQWTRTLSATILNQGRFGFNRSTTLVDLSNVANVPDSLNFIPGQPMGRMVIAGLASCCATINDPRYFRMNNFQPSDDLSITRGNHAIKTGFVVERFQWNTNNSNRIGGDFQFASLPAFLQATVQSVQGPFPGTNFNRGMRATLYGMYVQDDWRLTPRLTLNYGLRYELTTVPNEVNGIRSFLTGPLDTVLKNQPPFAGNHLNFAPRFGFAWDVMGNGKTSIRGGWGIYYDQIVLNQFLNLFDRQPPQYLNVSISGAAAAGTFPHPIDALRATAVFSPSTLVFDDFKTPYSYQYNLTVQREVLPSLVVSAGYVGSTGKHILQRYNGNGPIPTVLADGTLFIPAGSPRRNPLWGEMQTRSMSGFSNYNAFQLSVNRRFSRGLQVQGVYTFSRSIDTSGGLFSEEATNAATGAENPDRLFNEKALSNFDIRNIATINFNYELPFGKNWSGVARQIGGGWEFGGIVTLADGVPFTVENSSNRSRSGSTGANQADRPNLAPGANNNPTSGVSKGCTYGTVTIPAGLKLGTPDLFFDPCAFAPQPLGFFGNLGRNTAIGPGTTELDFLITKHFRFQEGRELQFRAEFFNIANHPNFAPPFQNTRRIFDGSTGGAFVGGSGTLTQTTISSRQIQFGLKYTF